MKNPPASARDARDLGSIPGSGRSPGGGHSNHSSILAWRIPWTEDPGPATIAESDTIEATERKHLYCCSGPQFPHLQSMGSQRVGHALAHTLSQSEYNGL